MLVCAGCVQLRSDPWDEELMVSLLSSLQPPLSSHPNLTIWSGRLPTISPKMTVQIGTSSAPHFQCCLLAHITLGAASCSLICFKVCHSKKCGISKIFNVFIFKEVSYAHQGCIYLIKNTGGGELILCNLK